MQERQRGVPEYEDGYELFRRAIVEGDGDAWAAIHRRYQPLLIKWAQQASAAAQTGEYYDDIADQAFARAWAALSPAHFGRFANLAALLAYLRACVVAVVIDYARAGAARARMCRRLETDTAATPEQIVLEEIERSDLWRLVKGLAETEQERMVLVETFVFNLPPRTIVARHSELFANTLAVYAAKRNLIARLQRNHEVRRLCQELHSA